MMLQPKSFSRNALLAIALATSGVMLPSATMAQDNQASASTQAVAAAASSQSPDDLLSVQSALKEMQVTIERIDRTAKDFVREANRQRVTLQDVPDLMDWNTYAITSTGTPDVPPGGLLPMRKDHVNLYRSDLDQLVPILGSDIENIHMPASLGEEAQVEWSAAKSALMNLHDSANLLDQLTAGSDYRNILIAKQAKRIHDDISGIDDIRKRMLKLIKKAD